MLKINLDLLLFSAFDVRDVFPALDPGDRVTCFPRLAGAVSYFISFGLCCLRFVLVHVFPRLSKLITMVSSFPTFGAQF